MRAYIIPSFGLPNLALAPREPAPIASHEVRVRVRAVSLNFRDLLTINGLYNPKQKLPLVPCSDGAGEVIEVGAAVTRFRVGDRVMNNFVQDWESGAPKLEKLRTTLGGPLDGMLQEERVLSERGLVRIPDYLSFAEAATLPCAALTAWSALEQAAVTSGQTVLVQGTGGVSLFALQLAKLRGARVIVTSKSDEKLVRARALGADETINYATTPEWGKAARALTGAEGLDLIVEVGGGGTLAQSIRATRPGGVIALIGVLSGVATELLLTPVLMQNIRIQGVIVGHREMFEMMARAMDVAKVRPVIDETFAFEDAPRAFARMAEGAHFGKIVVDVAGAR
jgi:NADPH:quinone reductase-like Zn-dependent oxidoreductase